MTKSTITREESVQAVFDLKVGYRLGFADLEILKRVACLALAAMDSEPVAEVVSIYGDPEAFGEREIRPLVGIQQMPYGTKLYRHAQPAPEKYNIGDATMRHIFTPTGMTNVSDMQAVFDRVEAVLVGMEQPAPVMPDKMTAIVKDEAEFVEGWNACRAAMLQAGTLTNEGTKQAWTGIPDIDNAINMLDRIDTLESCDDDRIEAVKTVLRGLAGNSQVIPDGYVMVPKEMTDEIGEAIAMQANCCGGIALDIYDAMLAAAPQEDINALIPLVSRNEQEVK
ncbi:hypothetical protein OW978_15750 [Klebsiella pneumoniae]